MIQFIRLLFSSIVVGMQMEKIIKFIRWPVRVLFFLAIAVMATYYWSWFQINPHVFKGGRMDGDTTGVFIFGIVLLLLYSFGVVILELVKKYSVVSIVLFFPILLLLCINIFYLNYFMPSLVSTAECHGVQYYITFNSPAHRPTTGWGYYQLTKWTSPSKYDSSFFGFAIAGYFPSQIICDERKVEVTIYDSHNLLLYQDGAQRYDYVWQESYLPLTYPSYDLFSYFMNGTRQYVMTVCQSETADTCQIIQIEHSSPTSQDEQAGLILDRVTHQVYILFDRKIWASFGDKTLKFTELSSLTKDEVSRYTDQYHLASYQKNNVYFYVLYRCNIDPASTDCAYVPFSYSTHQQESANLSVDKATDQFSVSIGETIIFTFTYDDANDVYKSYCHVEQCSIPDLSQ